MNTPHPIVPESTQATEIMHCLENNPLPDVKTTVSKRIPLNLSVFDELRVIHENIQQVRSKTVRGIHVYNDSDKHVQVATVLSYNEFDRLCNEID